MTTYRLIVPTALLVLLIGCPTFLQAQDHHPQEIKTGESQEAHIHGKAVLLIVLEGKQLAIELHSPAINLLGFEHYPSSAEQHAKVESAKNTLSNANDLFQINSETCQLTRHEVDFSSVTEEHHKTDKHGDIEAHYHYHCERPNQVSSLRTILFDQLPGVESLQVQWIVNGRQGAATLDNKLLDLYFK